MTHSRLRITHALTNHSHAPLSLLSFLFFHSHDDYSSLPHSLFDIISLTHQECTDHVWLCLVTVDNQHSGHLIQGPLMYIRKTATLWLDFLNFDIFGDLLYLSRSQYLYGQASRTRYNSSTPLLLAPLNSLSYTEFTSLG